MKAFSKFISLVLIFSMLSCTSAPPSNENNQTQQQQLSAQSGQTSPSYWIGDGGSGKSITILPPRNSGLTENLEYLPDLVANELVNNFSTFSAMTLFDRVNNQRQYEELLSGYYADDDAASLDLGRLTSTDYMLLGDITRTTTGYALQLAVNRNSDKTTVATYSGTVSIAELDNLTGVRRASLDLLQKIGIQVTAQARTELTRAATVDHVNAQTAMAHGISAQRQGTEVAALTYFYQAAAFDASLVEAVSRTNVLSTNISTGNIGANVRNDIAWRSDWVDKLTETETFINDMLRNTTTQRSIWYTTNVEEQESARDYNRHTTELRIEAALHTHAVFPVSVQRTVQAVYEGLQTTERAQAWGLNNWPRNGVTNINPFNRSWGGMVSIAFELINDQNQVIGRQTVEMDSRYSFSGTRLEGPGTVFTTVRFTGVNANAITDRMNIRIASINGHPPEEAGISRIEPISAQKMQENRNFTIYNGAIRLSSNERNLGSVTIPVELWGERVTAIANGAYERRRVTDVTIPEGIQIIGDRAFADNMWTTTERAKDGSSNTVRHGIERVVIPSSVISIGQEAFYSHWTAYDSYGNLTNHSLITEVTIGENVTLGNNAIGAGFERYYNNQRRQMGIYRRNSTYYSSSGGGWERFENVQIMKQALSKRTRNTIIFGGLGAAAFLGLLFLLPKPEETSTP